MEYLQGILAGQYEAALSMLKGCVEACPEGHWEGKIANVSFRQVVYHVLFFTDLYLTRWEGDFVLREMHRRGGDEREDAVSAGLKKEEILEYVEICRGKALAALAGESAEDLQGPSGFARCKMTRGEMHIYNIRHIQHHTGGMSAYLRRVGAVNWWRLGCQNWRIADGVSARDSGGAV